MTIHFVDITGTLQELGPGAVIQFNGHDGTRQAITLVDREDLRSYFSMMEQFDTDRDRLVAQEADLKARIATAEAKAAETQSRLSSLQAEMRNASSAQSTTDHALMERADALAQRLDVEIGELSGLLSRYVDGIGTDDLRTALARMEGFDTELDLLDGRVETLSTSLLEGESRTSALSGSVAKLSDELQEQRSNTARYQSEAMAELSDITLRQSKNREAILYSLSELFRLTHLLSWDGDDARRISDIEGRLGLSGDQLADLQSEVPETFASLRERDDSDSAYADLQFESLWDTLKSFHSFRRRMTVFLYTGLGVGVLAIALGILGIVL